MDKVHARKNSFSAPDRYRRHNRNISLVTLPSATSLGIGLGCTPISLTGCGAGCDCPRGTRDHLLDFGDHHNPLLVVSGALMGHWAAVVCTVAVGLVAGLLVLSAGL
jgi:hypothetical protein